MNFSQRNSEKFFTFGNQTENNTMKDFLFISILLFTLLSCHKDRDQDSDVLPVATQSGANTGGALVNGKIWVSKIEKSSIVVGENNTIYKHTNEYPNPYSLTIHLRNINNLTGNNITIRLKSSSDFVPGDYELNEIENSTGDYFTSGIFYFTDADNKGVLTITKFDKVNKIVSGTFSFKCRYYYTGEIVNITDGRFDRVYN